MRHRRRRSSSSAEQAARPSGATAAPAARRWRIPWRLLAVALLAAAVVGAIVFLRDVPLLQVLGPLVRRIRRAGMLGYLAFAAVYFGAVALGLPTSLLTVLAGFLWGPVKAAAVVIPPSLAGAAGAYALVRSGARQRIERHIRRYPRIAALDAALADRPVLIMTLLRLSPVLPSNVLSYVFALGNVRFRAYMAACTLAMLPGTLMFAYAGSAITSLRRLRSAESGAGASALYWVGLAATVIGTLALGWLARRALKRQTAGR